LDIKRVKTTEGEAIIRERKEREDAEKESEILLRGEVIPFHDIERYVRNHERRKERSKFELDSSMICRMP
jgi:hypothetical protein